MLTLAVCAVAIGGALVLLLHPYADSAESDRKDSDLNTPALYAELPNAEPQQPADASSSKKIDVPVLVYHVVRPSYPSDSAAVRAIAVTPETFDAEMGYLASAGYRIVKFSDLEAYFASSTPLPPKPVILSFDDGWGDQFAYAFPVLEKYRYPATFFVFTNAIDRPGFLTWDDLHALAAAGMTIGAHSRPHPYLTSIASESKLWSEIDGSRRLLEKELGLPVNEFAYPFGRYDAAIVSLVRKSGYRSARGDYYSGRQSADRLFELSAINAPTTIARFKTLLPAK